MEHLALLIMTALLVKHYIVDFPLQTEFQLKNKGTYWHPGGLIHASNHGIGTLLALGLVLGINYWFFILVMAVADAVIHYHIDWIKMRWGCGDISKRQFWSHLGLDQLAHQLVYVAITYICIA